MHLGFISLNTFIYFIPTVLYPETAFYYNWSMLFQDRQQLFFPHNNSMCSNITVFSTYLLSITHGRNFKFSPKNVFIINCKKEQTIMQTAVTCVKGKIYNFLMLLKLWGGGGMCVKHVNRKRNLIWKGYQCCINSSSGFCKLILTIQNALISML